MIFPDVTDCTSLAARNIIFKVTVKSLVFCILNFEVGKITATVLSCQRTFFHVNIVVLFLLL
jgi:hypothetical protein